YTAAAYDTSGLGATQVPTEAQMVAWAGGQDQTRTERSDMAYDFRGELSSITTYGSIDATGAGVATTASRTSYIYDYRGLLLQTITPDTKGITSYVYDGLGRVLSTLARSSDNSLSTTTLTTYDDAHGKTTIAYANGLSSTSAYDHAGRLVSVI